jgi:hypothetical protein
MHRFITLDREDHLHHYCIERKCNNNLFVEEVAKEVSHASSTVLASRISDLLKYTQSVQGARVTKCVRLNAAT